MSKKDFQSVFANPKKASHQYLVALYQPNQQAVARLGLIVAKRYVRLAVDRNRLRRIIRNSFRHHKEALKGLDIIVLMRSEWSPSDKFILRNDIDKLWQLIRP